MEGNPFFLANLSLGFFGHKFYHSTSIILFILFKCNRYIVLNFQTATAVKNDHFVQKKPSKGSPKIKRSGKNTFFAASPKKKDRV